VSKPDSLLKTEPAEHLRMHVRDAIGSKVMMDFYIVQCNDSIGFLVGLSEVQAENSSQIQSQVPDATSTNAVCDEGNEIRSSGNPPPP